MYDPDPERREPKVVIANLLENTEPEEQWLPKDDVHLRRKNPPKQKDNIGDYVDVEENKELELSNNYFGSLKFRKIEKKRSRLFTKQDLEEVDISSVKVCPKCGSPNLLVGGLGKPFYYCTDCGWSQKGETDITKVLSKKKSYNENKDYDTLEKLGSLKFKKQADPTRGEMEHERMRLEYMDFEKLTRRLGMMSKVNKLESFVYALKEKIESGEGPCTAKEYRRVLKEAKQKLADMQAADNVINGIFSKRGHSEEGFWINRIKDLFDSGYAPDDVLNVISTEFGEDLPRWIYKLIMSQGRALGKEAAGQHFDPLTNPLPSKVKTILDNPQFKVAINVGDFWGAKEIAVDTILNSGIKEIDKKRILNNIEQIEEEGASPTRLLQYLYNSYLKHIGLGIRGTKEERMKKSAQDINEYLSKEIVERLSDQEKNAFMEGLKLAILEKYNNSDYYMGDYYKDMTDDEISQDILKRYFHPAYFNEEDVLQTLQDIVGEEKWGEISKYASGAQIRDLKEVELLGPFSADDGNVYSEGTRVVNVYWDGFSYKGNPVEDGKVLEDVNVYFGLDESGNYDPSTFKKISKQKSESLKFSSSNPVEDRATDRNQFAWTDEHAGKGENKTERYDQKITNVKKNDDLRDEDLKMLFPEFVSAGLKTAGVNYLRHTLPDDWENKINIDFNALSGRYSVCIGTKYIDSFKAEEVNSENSFDSVRALMREKINIPLQEEGKMKLKEVEGKRVKIEDPKREAEKDSVLISMGMEMPAKYLHEKYGIPQAREGEKVIKRGSNSLGLVSESFKTRLVRALVKDFVKVAKEEDLQKVKDSETTLQLFASLKNVMKSDPTEYLSYVWNLYNTEQASRGDVIAKFTPKKASSLEVKDITFDDLLNLPDGLVLLGTGGDLQQWIDGVVGVWNEEGLVEGPPEEVISNVYKLTTTGGRIDLVLIFKKGFDINKLAMWRLGFGDASWVSDYKDNYRGQHNAEKRTKQARNWNLKLDFNFIQDADIPIEEAGKKAAGELRNRRGEIIDLGIDSDEVDNLIASFENAENIGEFNGVLSLLYDIGDENNIWVNTFSPARKLESKRNMTAQERKLNMGDTVTVDGREGIISGYDETDNTYKVSFDWSSYVWCGKGDIEWIKKEGPKKTAQERSHLEEDMQRFDKIDEDAGEIQTEVDELRKDDEEEIKRIESSKLKRTAQDDLPPMGWTTDAKDDEDKSEEEKEEGEGDEGKDEGKGDGVPELPPMPEWSLTEFNEEEEKGTAPIEIRIKPDTKQIDVDFNAEKEGEKPKEEPKEEKPAPEKKKDLNEIESPVKF